MERLVDGSASSGALESNLWGLLSPPGATAPRRRTEPVWSPSADVKLTPKSLTVFLDLPGVDEDTIDIDVHHNVLHICGEREFDHDQEDPEEFMQIGRSYGRYEFKMTLPNDVKSMEMTAKYKRGVLKVNLPRRERLR